MSLRTLQTVPLLRIFDVAKAREFYVDFLGFRVDWEHRFEADAPLYMQVSRDTCVLHLTEHHGDCCPGATVFVRVTGLEDFHDPFGNRLRFNEDVAPAATPAEDGRT